MTDMIASIPVNELIAAGIYLMVGIFGIPIINRVIARTMSVRYKYSKKSESKQKETITKLLQNVVKYIIWIIVIIGVLGAFGVETGALIASAGIVGFAFGFGAQNLIMDIIAGFFLIIEDQLDVGDYATINGFKGTIMEIGLKTTKIKNWLGEVKYIANGKIEEVINYSKENPFVYIDIPLTYEESIPKALKVISEINKKISSEVPEIIGDIEILGVNELADSSVNIRILAECAKETQFKVKRQMLETIKNELDKNNISIPYPHIEVIGK